MGLLSSRTFRQVATGALQGVEEKREKMRDRIDVYREKAIKRKDNLQKEYNAYYKEEKSNIQMFKGIATQVGEDYVPQLNSFVSQGGDINSLYALKDMDTLKSKLDGVKVDDTKPSANYMESSQSRLDLKKEEVNKSLQDNVGLFKGTSSLFTRDIERRGIQDIQSEIGSIDSGETIDTKFMAGKGTDDKNELTPKDKINMLKNYSDLYIDEDDGENLDNSILKRAEILMDNANDYGSVLITRQDAIAEIMYLDTYSNYKGDNLQYLTSVGSDDPQFKPLEEQFNVAINGGNTEEIKSIIEKATSLNKFVGKEYQNQYNTFLENLQNQPDTPEENLLISVQEKPSIFGTPLGSRQRKEREAEIKAWESTYGNTHFDDGTLMTQTQQQAWKESQAKKGGRSKNNIRKYVD